MVTVDNHEPLSDSKHPDSKMCFRCHLPVQHPVHAPKDKGVAIKGTATPDKLG
jgi:hypothetical protein